MGRKGVQFSPTKWLGIKARLSQEFSILNFKWACPTYTWCVCVHNLEAFLDSQLLLNEQVTSVAKKVFAQLHSWIRRPFRQLCILYDLTIRLLQCILYEATLKDYSKGSRSPECNGVRSYGHAMVQTWICYGHALD